MIKSIELYKKDIFSLILLFIILILCHFIPFERAIISPDTFSFIARDNYGISNFFITPDRPIEYLIHEFEDKYFEYNFNYYFYYLIFSNAFLIIVFNLFFRLFFNKTHSFIAGLIYSLLPYKLEIFHSSIFAWINIIDSFYILTLILFILHITFNKKYLLYFSALIYLFCILSRESGIFVPLTFIFF